MIRENIEHEIRLELESMGYRRNDILNIVFTEDNSLVTCKCNDGYEIQFQITDIEEFEYTNQFGKFKEDCFFNISEPIYNVINT